MTAIAPDSVFLFPVQNMNRNGGWGSKLRTQGLDDDKECRKEEPRNNISGLWRHWSESNNKGAGAGAMSRGGGGGGNNNAPETPNRNQRVHLSLPPSLSEREDVVGDGNTSEFYESAWEKMLREEKEKKREEKRKKREEDEEKKRMEEKKKKLDADMERQRKVKENNKDWLVNMHKKAIFSKYQQAKEDKERREGKKNGAGGSTGAAYSAQTNAASDGKHGQQPHHRQQQQHQQQSSSNSQPQSSGIPRKPAPPRPNPNVSKAPVSFMNKPGSTYMGMQGGSSKAGLKNALQQKQKPPHAARPATSGSAHGPSGKDPFNSAPAPGRDPPAAVGGGVNVQPPAREPQPYAFTAATGSNGKISLKSNDWVGAAPNVAPVKKPRQSGKAPKGRARGVAQGVKANRPSSTKPVKDVDSSEDDEDAPLLPQSMLTSLRAGVVSSKGLDSMSSSTSSSSSSSSSAEANALSAARQPPAQAPSGAVPSAHAVVGAPIVTKKKRGFGGSFIDLTKDDERKRGRHAAGAIELSD